jgi:hypothetical protein
VHGREAEPEASRLDLVSSDDVDVTVRVRKQGCAGTKFADQAISTPLNFAPDSSFIELIEKLMRVPMRSNGYAILL